MWPIIVLSTFLLAGTAAVTTIASGDALAASMSASFVLSGLVWVFIGALVFDAMRDDRRR